MRIILWCEVIRKQILIIKKFTKTFVWNCCYVSLWLNDHGYIYIEREKTQNATDYTAISYIMLCGVFNLLKVRLHTAINRGRFRILVHLIYVRR